MNTFSTTALADGGKAIALTVIFGLVLAFYPVVSIAAIAVIPIPAAYVTAKNGVAAGVAVGVLAGLICLLFEPLSGLLTCLLALIAGVGAGIALRHGISQSRLMQVLVGLFFLAFAAWAAVALINMGMGPVAAMQQASDQLVENARQTLAVAMGQDNANAYAQDLRDSLGVVPYLMPALLLVLSSVFAWACTVLARKVFDRLRQPFPHDFSFKEFRLHYVFIYMVSIGVGCELYAYFMNAGGGAVDLVGMNLLTFSLALFFVQGLAVAHYFLSYYKVSRPKRLAVYALLMVLQMFLLMVTWMGLFDGGLDYRRRFNKDKTQSQH